MRRISLSPPPAPYYRGYDPIIVLAVPASLYTRVTCVGHRPSNVRKLGDKKVEMPPIFFYGPLVNRCLLVMIGSQLEQSDINVLRLYTKTARRRTHAIHHKDA